MGGVLHGHLQEPMLIALRHIHTRMQERERFCIALVQEHSYTGNEAASPVFLSDKTQCHCKPRVGIS